MQVEGLQTNSCSDHYSCESCPVHRVCVGSPDYCNEEAAHVVKIIHNAMREVTDE